MTKVGLIGTGMLGEAVGLHLLESGYDLNVYNRTKSKTKNDDINWTEPKPIVEYLDKRVVGHQKAKNLNMKYIDATCPLVTKVHREAENLYKNNYHILLIGHLNHPEVIGTMGQLPKGAIDLIETVEDANNYLKKNKKKIAYVTQTTLSVGDTRNIVSVLKNKYPEIEEPAKEDICYATTNRQAAVKKIAKEP